MACGRLRSCGFLTAISTCTVSCLCRSCVCLHSCSRTAAPGVAFFIPLVVLAAPQLDWLFLQDRLGGRELRAVARRLGPGLARVPLWFWFLNTGLAIPAVVAALVWR